MHLRLPRGIVVVILFTALLLSGIAATLAPHYSAHALGVQTNFVVQNKGLVLFFKYYNEQNAKAHPEGDTFVFGGSWTIRIPKS